MWFLLLWVISLITSSVYFLMYGLPTSVKDVSSILLLHQFVVTFGLLGLIGFIESVLFGKKISKIIGWPGGPYQTKYGFFQLNLGVIGVMTIWFDGLFWLAALVSMYVFGLSGLWTHISEIMNHKKSRTVHIVNIVINVCYQIFLTVLYIFSRV